jgi:MFS family permease
MFVLHLSLVTLFVGTFAIGLAGQGAKICVDAVVQDTVDDAFIGRVFSFYDVVFNAAFVSAAGLSVLLLPSDGYSTAVFGGVAVLFAVAAATYLVAEWRRASAFDFEDEPGLPPEVDPSPGSDHSWHARLDSHGGRAR